MNEVRQSTGAHPSSPSPSGIPEEFLKLLVCPVDHSSLEVTTGGLKCSSCHRIFKVENGIPNFVIDE